MEKLVQVEFVITGIVQGVGFRYFVYQNAKSVGLNGYAKNLHDGSVFVAVEGKKSLIERFHEKLKIGPMMSHVDSITVESYEFSSKYRDFNIL